MTSNTLLLDIEDGRLMIRLGDTVIYQPIKAWNGMLLMGPNTYGEGIKQLTLDYEIAAQRKGYESRAHELALYEFFDLIAQARGLDPFDAATAAIDPKGFLEGTDIRIKHDIFKNLSPMTRARVRQVCGVNYTQQWLEWSPTEGNYPQ